MHTRQARAIRPGDVIDVRIGPSGTFRRGTVVDVRHDDDAPGYEVAWDDGTSTRLYVSARLVTVVAPGAPGEVDPAVTGGN